MGAGLRVRTMTATGTVSQVKSRLWKLNYTPQGTAGQIALSDGSSGPVVVDIQTRANADFIQEDLPKSVDFESGIELTTLTNVDDVSLYFEVL